MNTAQRARLSSHALTLVFVVMVGLANRWLRPRCSIENPVFRTFALAPAPSAAEFFPAFDQQVQSHLQIIDNAQHGLIEATPSEGASPLPEVNSPKRRPPSKRLTRRLVVQVENAIFGSKNARHAVFMLSEELGWETTEGRLIHYMKKYGISTRWLVADIREWFFRERKMRTQSSKPKGVELPKGTARKKRLPIISASLTSLDETPELKDSETSTEA